jgi:GNAT superfamily N-acetyltransferase
MLDSEQRQKAPVALRSFVRLERDMDVAPTLAAIEAKRWLWDQITDRQEHPASPHHDTRAIWLRGPGRLDVDSVFNDLHAEDYPAAHELAPAITSLLGPALDSLRITELGRVMIVSLKPGGSIDPHADEGRYAEHYSRFHLVLTSDEGNEFTCGEESVHMQAGEVWWFNHQLEHAVSNRSKRERIHVIFDAVTPLFTPVKLPAISSVALADGIYEMPYDAAAREADPLLAEHWDEVAKNKQVMVLKPDHDGYRQMERVGRMLILGAYRDGKMVGYSFNFIGPHLHYADLIVCNNDVLFVHRDHRNSPIGLQLIRRTEKAAKARGARLMLWHAKQGTSLDKIMPRMNYGVQDIIYSKEI